MPKKVDLSYAIGLKPEGVINYFKSKGYKFSFDWNEIWQDAHHKSFTVAKAMRLDILKDIRIMLDKALEDGITFEEFRHELEPILKAKGWWGKTQMFDNEGNLRDVQLGSVKRLDTIYHTNLNVAYSIGEYNALIKATGSHPYWKYVAILDENTRELHADLHGKIWKFDDPFWDKYFPPNDWGCRCTVTPMTITEVSGKKVETGIPVDLDENNFAPDEWRFNPGKKAFFPDLDKYDYDIAVQTVKTGLNDPDYKYFYDEKIQGAYVVAILDQIFKKQINANTQQVLLSSESLVKNKIQHPDLSFSDYKNLPEIISKATLIVQDGENILVFIKKNGKTYHAVIKSTNDGDELFLTSFRLTTSVDLERMKRRGKILVNRM